MRKMALVAAVSMGLIAGCRDGDGTSSQARVEKQPGATAIAHAAMPQRREGEAFANAPDHGALLTYARQAPVKKGAYTWHEAQLSEAHALHAMVTGTMDIPAPDGTPIRLKYVSHEEHSDGNWTWVGRTEGAQPGQEAVITFGKDAVFASIPNGRKEPLQVTTTGGRSYVIETDPRLVSADKPSDVDFLVPTGGEAAAMLPLPKSTSAAGALRLQSSGLIASKASTVGTTVDIVLGYTSTFATRLGGVSQAQTRLAFLVDLANQAFVNSEVDGRLRLVSTLQVNYTDINTNRAALFELSGVTCTSNPTGSELPDGGVNCTAATVPAALQPLIAARDAYGADLVSLVRPFEDPEQGSCGIGWMLGGGQSALDQADAPFGISVISDTSGNTFPDPDTNATCRNETLVHETGHNFGLQHDVDTADRGDNILQPGEFGHFPYSFGYVAPADQGNFYTVMSIRRPGLNAYNVFSNPSITFCGGFACGTDTADNARALRQTIPIIANFRAAIVPITGAWLRGDYNGDGRADILWRNRDNGLNVIWNSGNAQTVTSMRSVPDLAWQAIGSADFNGDGADDVVWRNANTGQSVIWRSGDANTAQNLGNPPGWRVVGAGDFDGDGSDDVLWRNDTTGGNLYWRSANSAQPVLIQSLPDKYWTVVGTGDFNADGRADILWRNFSTGANVIWLSGNASTALPVATVGFAWAVAGVGDFNGDNVADILWRNQGTGQNLIWRSGNSATTTTVSQLGLPWAVMGVGDFDGDGSDDILWRNLGNGLNGIWRSGNSATATSTLGLATVWFIAG